MIQYLKVEQNRVVQSRVQGSTLQNIKRKIALICLNKRLMDRQIGGQIDRQKTR